MQTRCRVEDETREYLEDEARLEIEHEQRERMKEKFNDVEYCVMCESNKTCDEMSGEDPDICDECWSIEDE